MKNLRHYFFITSLCFGSMAFANSEVATRQDIMTDTKYVLGEEESEITKEYVTALALDGMRRLFELGLEFLNKDENSTLRHIQRKEEAIECCFQHALISNEEDRWSPHYVECVKATDQITGNLGRDGVKNGISLATDKRVRDPKFSKPSSYDSIGGLLRDDWYVPGPLIVIYWAMENIGKAAIDFSKDQSAESKFSEAMIAIIELIEAHNRIGQKAYITEMNKHLQVVQNLITSYAKSNVNRDGGILNLLNLRLTEEGASKLGQVAFEEVNRAYASMPMTSEKAKALALFVLNRQEIEFLLQKQNGGDLRDFLDEVIDVYNLIFNKYAELTSSSKSSIRMAEKLKIAMKALGAYYFNDMYGFTGRKVEADPLKNAFKIGRILDQRARTTEYNPEERTTVRHNERNTRVKEYQQENAKLQNLQLGSGETQTPKLVESGVIKDEL